MTREMTTSLSPREVLEEAKRFFMSDLSVYSAWLEQESDNHCTFSTFRSRIAIAAFADPQEEAPTRVRISTLRVEEAVGKFLTYLRTVDSPGLRREEDSARA